MDKYLELDFLQIEMSIVNSLFSHPSATIDIIHLKYLNYFIKNTGNILGSAFSMLFKIYNTYT